LCAEQGKAALGLRLQRERCGHFAGDAAGDARHLGRRPALQLQLDLAERCSLFADYVRAIDGDFDR
jgi:hypothetical protein